MPFQGPALPTMALPPADGMSSAQLGRAAMAMARRTGEARTVPYLGSSWGGKNMKTWGIYGKTWGIYGKTWGIYGKNMENLW